ncbi:carbohydrate-binding module family 48 protein [Xylariaceae sp. FL0594]|nr:carbohydrate-binding module family 48 protein [Xylariaceae sp. FL0594]
MGSFVFKWNHPANEVYVTGTFDEWNKTEKLEKVGEGFEKRVTLPDISKKIFYKFVVDGEWVTDHTAPKEYDASGIENNVLNPDQIIVEAPATTAIMSSAAPESTTAALAAAVPLETETKEEVKTEESSETKSALPGAFPETPAADLQDADNAFSVNPLPAAPGGVNPITLAPGEKIPEGLAAKSTTDHVKLDPESYEKSDTLPGGLPATFSSAAPVSTTAALAADAPIEPKVPDVVKESQEKADASPEASEHPEEVKEKAAVEEELLEKVKEAPSTSEGTAGVGTEKTEDVVSPGEAAASVVAAASALAGAAVAGATAAKHVIVDTAQDSVAAAQAVAASAATSAAAGATAAKDIVVGKGYDSAVAVQEAAASAANSAAAGATAAKDVVVSKGYDSAVAAQEAAASAASSAAAQLPEAVKERLPESALNAVGATTKEHTRKVTREEVSQEVPEAVKHSIAEAGESPEAAANAEAVEEKKAVEAELLREADAPDATDDAANEEISSSVPIAVKESYDQAGVSPEAATNTDAVVEKWTMENELLRKVHSAEQTEEVASTVPAAVQDSIAQAGKAPEAAANAEAVEEKKAVEDELLREVKPVEAAGESANQEAAKTVEAPAVTESPAVKDIQAVPATTDAPGTSIAAATTETPAVVAAAAAAGTSTTEAPKSTTATNGNKAAAEPTTPAKPTAESSASSSKATDSPSTTEKKKKNRLSAMFGKVKSKLSHK